MFDGWVIRNRRFGGDSIDVKVGGGMSNNSFGMVGNTEEIRGGGVNRGGRDGGRENRFVGAGSEFGFLSWNSRGVFIVTGEVDYISDTSWVVNIRVWLLKSATACKNTNKGPLRLLQNECRFYLVTHC